MTEDNRTPNSESAHEPVVPTPPANQPPQATPPQVSRPPQATTPPGAAQFDQSEWASHSAVEPTQPPHVSQPPQATPPPGAGRFDQSEWAGQPVPPSQPAATPPVEPHAGQPSRGDWASHTAAESAGSPPAGQWAGQPAPVTEPPARSAAEPPAQVPAAGHEPTFEQLSSEWANPGTNQPNAAQPNQAEWANDPARPTERVLYGSAVGNQPGPGAPPHGNYPSMSPPFRVGGANQPPRGSEPKRRGSGALVVGVAVLSLLVGGGAGAVGGYLASDSNANNAPVVNALDDPKPAEQASSAPAGSVEAVAAKVSPSVVQLQVQGRSSAGEGSGFVINSDGLILTNNHVVEAAAQGGKITAVFSDGTTATATVVGRDPTSDVAVVKAEGKSGLPVVELGRSDDLKVGEGVVAIGSPFELAGTVTTGIVSSLHRPTRAGGEGGSQATVMDAIQTDAAINPGNSGGPLVNMRGQVIGINSAIYTPPTGGNTQGGSVGIGFSIPIDQARRTADEIVKTGKATQTVLGVSVRDNQDGGALIVDVVAGGAGEQAGLKNGDVVTKMDDRKINTSDALVAAVRSHKPGDKVRLELSNGSHTVEATLAGQTVETE